MLPNVNTSGLKKVLEYIVVHHNNTQLFNPIPKPLTDDIELHISKWDAEFIKSLELSQRIEILMAADYMRVDPLFELMCASISDICRKLKPDEFRSLFGIDNDFTTEELDAIEKENQWCSGY